MQVTRQSRACNLCLQLDHLSNGAQAIRNEQEHELASFESALTQVFSTFPIELRRLQAVAEAAAQLRVAQRPCVAEQAMYSRGHLSLCDDEKLWQEMLMVQLQKAEWAERNW